MPYNPNFVPDAPLPISMLPDAEELSDEDLLLLTQLANVSGRSRRLSVGTLIDYLLATRTASASAPGVVKVGSTLEIDAAGLLNLKNQAVTTDKLAPHSVTREKISWLPHPIRLLDDQGQSVEGTSPVFNNVSAGQKFRVGYIEDIVQGQIFDVTFGARISIPQDYVRDSYNTLTLTIEHGTAQQTAVYTSREIGFSANSINIRERLVFQLNSIVTQKRLALTAPSGFEYNRFQLNNITFSGWVY